MSDRQLPALILAGGDRPEKVALHFGLSHKALTLVAGEPVIARVVRALQDAAGVSEVVVASSCAELAAVLPPDMVVVAPAGGEFLDTLHAGFRHFAESEHLLLCTCDLPLLTPEAVDDFLAQALDTHTELCYSIVEGGRLTHLPGSGQRLLIRLQEGAFTGGNLVCLSRSFVMQEGARVSQAFAGRKSPLALARMLGVGFILRLLSGRLSLAQIRAKAERLMGVPVGVIDSHYAEVCFDIDSPEHVELAETVLAAQSAPAEPAGPAA
ncbi:MAG TPA: nucleotidyltransferase family protein [Armatimonadota bacterium]|jgi:molybdopterin-guanine dinucleotide biosynthesis protein A